MECAKEFGVLPDALEAGLSEHYWKAWLTYKAEMARAAKGKTDA